MAPAKDARATAIAETENALSVDEIANYLDRTSFSADTKALILDIAGFTVKVGGTIVSLGRKIITFVLELLRAFPNTIFGAAMALVISMIVAGPMGAVPVIGVKLATFLKSILLLFGMSQGALHDMKSGVMAQQVNVFVDRLSPLAAAEQ